MPGELARFAHGVANQLVAIRLRAELALGALGSDEAKVRRQLEGILDEAKRASLAARRVQSAAAEAGTAAGEPAPGGTVLLVEDDPAVRSVAAELLEDAGHIVLPAADGAEAIEVSNAHEAAIDVVLTDLTMPGPPVEETIARLRERRPGVAVVYMSGRGGGGFDEGDEIFLQKPFSGVELAAAVAAALARRSG
jgi:CheY-like chemotaxis protein